MRKVWVGGGGMVFWMSRSTVEVLRWRHGGVNMQFCAEWEAADGLRYFCVDLSFSGDTAMLHVDQAHAHTSQFIGYVTAHQLVDS
jgi:hypothetical protein